MTWRDAIRERAEADAKALADLGSKDLVRRYAAAGIVQAAEAEYRTDVPRLLAALDACERALREAVEGGCSVHCATCGPKYGRASGPCDCHMDPAAAALALLTEEK